MTQRFTLTRTLTGDYSMTLPPAPVADRENLRYSVHAFGFLVPRNTRMSGPEFATRIRDVYTHPRAELIAQTLERY